MCRHTALKDGNFAYTGKLERDRNLSSQSLLRPSVLQLMIPADSRRHVTAGSETKLQQWQVKPTRSHVFLMPRCIYLPHKDLHTSVNVRFVVSSRFTATLLVDQDTVHKRTEHSV